MAHVFQPSLSLSFVACCRTDVSYQGLNIIKSQILTSVTRGETLSSPKSIKIADVYRREPYYSCGSCKGSFHRHREPRALAVVRLAEGCHEGSLAVMVRLMLLAAAPVLAVCPTSAFLPHIVSCHVVDRLSRIGQHRLSAHKMQFGRLLRLAREAVPSLGVETADVADTRLPRQQSRMLVAEHFSQDLISDWITVLLGAWVGSDLPGRQDKADITLYIYCIQRFL